MSSNISTIHDYQRGRIAQETPNPELEELFDDVAQLCDLTKQNREATDNFLTQIREANDSLPKSMSAVEVTTTFFSSFFSKILWIFTSAAGQLIALASAILRGAAGVSAAVWEYLAVGGAPLLGDVGARACVYKN